MQQEKPWADRLYHHQQDGWKENGRVPPFCLLTDPAVLHPGLWLNGLLSLFTESTHWADSVLESQCPSVCVPVCAIGCSFFQDLTYWPWDHMISSQASHWSMGKALQPLNWSAVAVELQPRNWSAAGAAVQSDESWYFGLALSVGQKL